MDSFKIRIETDTQEEINAIINMLEICFRVEKDTPLYEPLNAEGFYHYFKLKPLSNVTKKRFKEIWEQYSPHSFNIYEFETILKEYFEK